MIPAEERGRTQKFRFLCREGIWAHYFARAWDMRDTRLLNRVLQCADHFTDLISKISLRLSQLILCA